MSGVRAPGSGGLWRPAAVLVIAAMACGGPGQGVPSPVAGTQPTPVAAPTPLPLGLEPEGDDGPPTSLTDALQSQVDAGAISYEESLLLGLRLLTGQAETEVAFAQPPTEMEGTGAIHNAQLYLQNGAEPATRAEIERLLRVLAPPPEILLRHSSPRGATSGRGPGVARLRADELECATLWEAGFPTPQPEEKPVQCFEYKEAIVGSSTVQVFYPITTLAPGFTVAFADAAFQAVVDSLKAYAPLAAPGSATVLKNVQVIFSLLPGKSGAFALTPTAPGHDPCQIVMFPLSMTRVSSGPGGPPPKYALFQQNVAHELFHCFQIWNFPKQSADASWDVQDWWAESTAEYFSNVVYPGTNDEWRFMDEWLGDAATVSIFEESYENFGLFQYLGNKLGNNGVLGLIKHMEPAAKDDEDAQAAQLATFPNIQTLFAEYARDFVDGKIADTSKKIYPTSPPVIHPDYQVDVSQAMSKPLDAAPFTLIRYKLTFAPGKEYQAALTDQGGNGVRTSRTVLPAGPWGDLPASIKPACGPTEYYLVMTTTQPSSAPYKVRLDVATGDAIGCDTCLIGTWDLNVPSFVEYSEAPFAETSDLYSFDSAGGLWRYRFHPDGTFSAEFDFFSSSTLHQSGGGFGADVDVNQVITIVGPGQGTYLSDGLNNLTIALVDDNVNLSGTTTINGEDIGDLFDALSGYSFLKGGASMVYSCDADAGILELNVAPQANLPPIRFDRVSTDPNKP